MTSNLRCACCGGDAGIYDQFHNQDEGFGICLSCVEWQRKRFVADEFASFEAQMLFRFGKEGINYPSRMFSGMYPCGIVCADRMVEVNGDYKRVAFLPYNTLKLEIADPHSPILEKVKADAALFIAGQSLQIAGNCTITLGGSIEKS